jgi:putative sigma-54 modulation protein
MQIHLTPQHLQLTASIHQAVAGQISSLEDLGTQIVGAHVVLLADHGATPTKRHTVKIHLAIPGPDIYAEDSEADLYIALERATDKVARQLRKRKTSLNDKRRRTTQRAVEQQRTAGTVPRAIRKGVKVAAR